MSRREFTPLTPTLSQGERRQRGFTLVEMVMVIVILGIASVALMDQFVNASKSYLIDEQLQTSTQLAQECAEHILATRRLQGYATAIATNCLALPAAYTTAGYARNATPGVEPAFCITSPCVQVDVVVTQGATERARVVFMLGSY
ncbi:MAG: prepilin-type N-terminal cleavage/methylation domain-containing protein [Gammaproteobacteria bacterium]|nr:prepilin-type N-terminal cleavage/methylation domain-containing protein [Gammaproteobacteria bacterium]